MKLGFLVPIAIKFAMRQARKFGASLDLAKVRADLETRVKDLVPGEMWDEAATKLADKLFQIIAGFLTTDILEKLAEEAFEKDYSGMLEDLKVYVVEQLKSDDFVH